MKENILFKKGADGLAKLKFIDIGSLTALYQPNSASYTEFFNTPYFGYYSLSVSEKLAFRGIALLIMTLADPVYMASVLDRKGAIDLASMYAILHDLSIRGCVDETLLCMLHMLVPSVVCSSHFAYN